MRTWSVLPMTAEQMQSKTEFNSSHAAQSRFCLTRKKLLGLSIKYCQNFIRTQLEIEVRKVFGLISVKKGAK